MGNGRMARLSFSERRIPRCLASRSASTADTGSATELLAVLVAQERICQFGTEQSLDSHGAPWLLASGPENIQFLQGTNETGNVVRSNWQQ
jgi:hypothetical protein